VPELTETAVLAGGCFWPAQALLDQRPGVLSTRVGYTGGRNSHATPDDHPGHAEAVEVVFDPAQTTFRDIVEFFLQIHRADLTAEAVGSDYRSEIFCVSEDQRRVSAEAVAAVDAAGLWPGPLVTRISNAGPFWESESEDQHYLSGYPDTKNQLRPRRPATSHPV
jgi:peptide-methionine (S)-S-oxide reductase